MWIDSATKPIANECLQGHEWHDEVLWQVVELASPTVHPPVSPPLLNEDRILSGVGGCFILGCPSCENLFHSLVDSLYIF